MNTDIEYRITGYGIDADPEIKIENVLYWIGYGLDGGIARSGIEKKLDRIISVLSILTEKFLIENPDQLKEIADILGEEREEGHRLVEEK